MKYGFIGLGNMGGAIIRGMIAGGQFEEDEICGFDLDVNKAKQFQEETGISLLASSKDTADQCDVIVLAVKPQYMQDVLDEVKQADVSGKLFVSIAAGLSTEYFQNELGEKVRVVRVMPNLNAAYRDAISGLCAGSSAKEDDLQVGEKIFSAVGTTVRISEDKLAAFSAVAGASPAFAFMYADALAMAAVKAGIPRSAAIKIASAALRGSGTTLMESGVHPDELRDRVCSPGGTTIEGVAVLERNGFKSILMDAVDAVIEKDRKLGKKD